MQIAASQQLFWLPFAFKQVDDGDGMAVMKLRPLLLPNANK